MLDMRTHRIRRDDQLLLDVARVSPCAKYPRISPSRSVRPQRAATRSLRCSSKPPSASVNDIISREGSTPRTVSVKLKPLKKTQMNAARVNEAPADSRPMVAESETPSTTAAKTAPTAISSDSTHDAIPSVGTRANGFRAPTEETTSQYSMKKHTEHAPMAARASGRKPIWANGTSSKPPSSPKYTN